MKHKRKPKPASDLPKIEFLGKGQARKAAEAIRKKRRKQKEFIDSL